MTFYACETNTDWKYFLLWERIFLSLQRSRSCVGEKFVCVDGTSLRGNIELRVLKICRIFMFFNSTALRMLFIFHFLPNMYKNTFLLRWFIVYIFIVNCGDDIDAELLFILSFRLWIVSFMTRRKLHDSFSFFFQISCECTKRLVSHKLVTFAPLSTTPKQKLENFCSEFIVGETENKSPKLWLIILFKNRVKHEWKCMKCTRHKQKTLCKSTSVRENFCVTLFSVVNLLKLFLWLETWSLLSTNFKFWHRKAGEICCVWAFLGAKWSHKYLIQEY